MLIELNDAELATVLAALRYWQRCEANAIVERAPEWDIASDSGDPLSVNAVDDLCERLNNGFEPAVARLYRYAELSPVAKQRAADWWRDRIDASDFICVIDDALTVAKMLGVETSHDRLYWSWMHCQGGGACFAGTWSGEAVNAAALHDYAPLDEDLHNIAKDLSGLLDYTAIISEPRGLYTHENSVIIDVRKPLGPDEGGQEGDIESCAYDDLGAKKVEAALRRFMKWIYGRLIEQDLYLTSDEAISEAMEAGDYTFTADGTRCDT
jgi:hypothetical protein